MPLYMFRPNLGALICCPPLPPPLVRAGEILSQVEGTGKFKRTGWGRARGLTEDGHFDERHAGTPRTVPSMPRGARRSLWRL